MMIMGINDDKMRSVVVVVVVVRVAVVIIMRWSNSKRCESNNKGMKQQKSKKAQ